MCIRDRVLVLVRLRVDPGDLVQPELEQVGLLRALAGVTPAVGQVVDHLAPAGERLAVAVQQLLVAGAGEPVQRGPLLARAQQAQLVGLAVHGQHLLTQLAERGDRHAAAADVRPGPALGGHRAAQQQRAVVVDLTARVRDPGADGIAERALQLQPALDHRTARVGADPAGVGPATEQKSETGHDHRLAGAGLTGDHVHPRGKPQGRVVDDAEPGDAQFLQHRAEGSGTLRQMPTAGVSDQRQSPPRTGSVSAGFPASPPPVARTSPPGCR